MGLGGHKGQDAQGREWFSGWSGHSTGRSESLPQLYRLHLLQFRGEHLHCMALMTSWYTTEPLVQCRGTRMGSVLEGRQQEHCSCTSSMSMEYTALLAHFPCNTSERGGITVLDGAAGFWDHLYPSSSCLTQRHLKELGSF